jgi:uncharacterized membrane protein
MRHLLDALHILFAIFAIGPLAHAATTAARGVRQGDRHAIAASIRMVRIYSYASLLVVVFGLALVQSKYGHSFSDTWIWLSLLLYVISLAVLFAVLLPGLEHAEDALTRPGVDATVGNAGGAASAMGRAADTGAAVAVDRSVAARIAAAGGSVGLIYAIIVFLMVYKPGS